MTITIITTGATLAAVNERIAERENITVPLIGITDRDNAEPTHYGAHYALGDKASYESLKRDNPEASIFTDTDFDKAAAELGLRRKPGEMP